MSKVVKAIANEEGLTIISEKKKGLFSKEMEEVKTQINWEEVDQVNFEEEEGEFVSISIFKKDGQEEAILGDDVDNLIQLKDEIMKQKDIKNFKVTKFDIDTLEEEPI